MRIGRARIGREKQLRRTDPQGLKAKRRLVLRPGQRLEKRPIGHDAVKAGDARRERFELGDEVFYAGTEFCRIYLGCPRARALHRIGEAKAVLEQKVIMLRFNTAVQLK